MVHLPGPSKNVLGPQICDDLTQLALRAALAADFQQLSREQPLSLLMCDLDHLKLLNDTLGHAAGDQALITLSAALDSNRHSGWRAYRLGGDEFALLAPVPAAELRVWAQRLLESMQQAAPPISVSAGVAEVARGADLAQVLAVADQRLYTAKRRGKARIISQDSSSPFEAPTPRLLERGQDLAQATEFLQAALQGLKGAAELRVYAPPGGGLSAFLLQAEVVARILGYQTLHLTGTPARACQHSGAWDQATFNGQWLSSPLTGDPLLPPNLPLAVFLDRPEYFDAATLAALQPLLRTAQAVLRGQVSRPAPTSLAPLYSPPHSAQLNLEPLSENALEGLLGGWAAGKAVGAAHERLGPQARHWLHQRAGGLPKPTLRWLAALRLEASLRREPLAQMLASGPGDWESAAAHHLSPPLLWPRPLLYGRRAELQDAVQRLSLSRLLTITGPAGRGKIRLAEQLLGELGGHFASVQQISLSAALDTGAALSRLAEALLGRPSEQTDLASLGRLLARQPTLMLLDDPAGNHLSAQMLETLLSYAPLCRLIVTAPAPLGAQHENVLALGLLSEQSVLAALQSAGKGHLTAAQLKKMAEWVSGEPLRLSTAAALLHADPASAVECLDGEEPYPAWMLLGVGERRVLAALSSVSGPLELRWAATLSGASPFVLGALRDQQYLQAVGGGLYRLSSALGTGARTIWQRSPGLRRQVRQRGLGQIQRLLSAQPQGSAAWYLQLDQHYPAVRAVVAGLLPRRAPLGSELARVLLDLTPYRLSRGYLPEARAELELALKLGAALEPGLRQRLHLTLASVTQQSGDHAAAQASLKSAAQSGANPETELAGARVLHRRSLYPQSYALYQEVGAQPDLPLELAVRAMEGQARSAIYLGQLDEAQQLIEAALSSTEQHLETWGELLLSEVLNTAALIATEQRRLDEAKALFERALEIHHRFGHRAGLTLNLNGLAWVLLLSGDFQRSAELSRQVLRQSQDAGRLWEEANALINLGHALTRSGELAQARQAYRQGGELAQQHDAPSLVAEALGGLAEVLSGEQQRERARRLLSVALTHPGANAETHQYFAALTADLQPPLSAESSETADWSEWLLS